MENYAEPTKEAEGGFDIVVYCADCSEELSRTHQTLDKLTTSDTPAAPDTPDTPSQPDQPSGGESGGRACEWCGKTSHRYRWEGFVHSVFTFVKEIFEHLNFIK